MLCKSSLKLKINTYEYIYICFKMLLFISFILPKQIIYIPFKGNISNVINKLNLILKPPIKLNLQFII